jgi:hypothetical protein
MGKYHLKHQGPQIDALLDKADTALQEHQDISHLASFADLQAGLADKVNKIDGKSLSTEDFTTALKQKLEGLQNYDDTAINEAINKLEGILNTIVDRNASDAIESFNEIIAFLNGIKDSQNLDSIIASIEQQIAAKQGNLVSGETIKTINGQSILGKGDITVHGGGGEVPADVMEIIDSLYTANFSADFNSDFTI